MMLLMACGGDNNSDCPKEKDLVNTIAFREITNAFPDVILAREVGTATDQAEVNELWEDLYGDAEPPEWQAGDVIVWASYRGRGCGLLEGGAVFTAWNRADGGVHFQLDATDTTGSCTNTTCDDEYSALMVAAVPATEAGTSVCAQVDQLCDPPENYDR
jgi:hypothetical protein